MKIDIGDAARAAWVLFKRDRDVLLALAGIFMFLPTLALMLLLPSPPAALATGASETATQLWASNYLNWIVACSPWLILATAVSMVGALSVISFYLAPVRPHVGGAIAVAVRHFPTYALLMVGVTLVASLGVVLFVLPGLWILGRTMLTGAALIAEGRRGGEPVRRSIGLTRGSGLVMAGLAGLSTFGIQLLLTPFSALDEAMRAARAVNPVAIMLVDVGGAAVAAAGALAIVLLQVTIYWRGAGVSKGI